MTVRNRNVGPDFRGGFYFKPTQPTDPAASSYDYKQAYWDGTDLWRVQGMCKVHNRGGSVSKGTTDAFALEVKSEPTTVNAEHNCITVTTDARGDFVAGGSARAGSFVSRVKSGQTFSSTASIIGSYNNITNLGTINGTATHAAIYGIIGAGGTWTACTRVANLWLDNHLAAAPGAGNMTWVHISNNAAAIYNEAFYMYGGYKIAKLFSLDLCTGANGFVKATGTAKAAGTESSHDLYCKIDGTAAYIKAYAVA